MGDTQDPGWLSVLLARFSKNRKRAQDFDFEVVTLLDAVVLSKPAIVHYGFQLYDHDGSQVEIRSLGDLIVNRPYRTEQQTPLVRNNQDGVIIGGKIILGVGSPSGTMSGTVLPEIALLALENQCKRTLGEGILFMEEDENPKIFRSIEDLITDTKYITPDGEITLMRLPSGNVQFQFAPSGSKFSSFLVPPADITAVNAEKLRAKARSQWIWDDTKAAKPTTNTRANNNRSNNKNARPNTKQYAAVPLMDDDKENVNDINTFTSSSVRPNNRPKPMMTANGTAPAPRGNSATQNAQHPQRNQVMSPRRAAHTQRTSYASTIPQTGLVARLAQKILNKWFNSRKEYAPVELHAFTDPPSPLGGRSAAATAPVQKTEPGPLATNIPAPPPPPPMKIPPPPPPPMMKKKGVTTPSKTNGTKMKQLHWSVIPSNQLKNAEFWSNISPMKFSRINETELESLFSISPAKERDLNKSKGQTVPKQESILDIRKANNTSIILAQFRLTPTCIREKLAAMDDSFTTDQLIALHSILTSISEQDVKALNKVNPAHASALNTPDLFVYELLRIPHCERRVRAWLVKRQMQTHIEDLENILDLVERASNEVRASAKFADLLKMVLALGSVLNRGTYLSNAKGFKLDSLLRLGEMKARRSRQSIGGRDDSVRKQANYSLLHYLAEVMARDNPELLEVGTELPHVFQATGLGLENAVEILSDCKENYKLVETLVADLAKLSTTDPFLNTLQPFSIDAQKRLATLTTRLSAATALYSSLASYYGEDPKTLGTKEFFSILSEFTKSLEQAHADNEKQRRQFARRASISFMQRPASITNLSVDDLGAL